MLSERAARKYGSRTNVDCLSFLRHSSAATCPSALLHQVSSTYSQSTYSQFLSLCVLFLPCGPLCATEGRVVGLEPPVWCLGSCLGWAEGEQEQRCAAQLATLLTEAETLLRCWLLRACCSGCLLYAGIVRSTRARPAFLNLILWAFFRATTVVRSAMRPRPSLSSASGKTNIHARITNL